MNNSWSKDEIRWRGVRLPWKIDPKILENNRIHALQRDENLNMKLSKNVEVEELFSEEIKEMIQKVQKG